MQIARCVPMTANNSLEMKNLRPCNDTFCSENGPKKGDFGLKTAKAIETRCFEGNTVQKHTHKIQNANCLLSPHIWEQFPGNEQLPSVQ